MFGLLGSGGCVGKNGPLLFDKEQRVVPELEAVGAGECVGPLEREKEGLTLTKRINSACPVSLTQPVQPASQLCQPALRRQQISP